MLGCFLERVAESRRIRGLAFARSDQRNFGWVAIRLMEMMFEAINHFASSLCVVHSKDDFAAILVVHSTDDFAASLLE